MLEITNLFATVADKPILNGLSLHVPATARLSQPKWYKSDLWDFP